MDQILYNLEYETYLDTSNKKGLGRWENVQEYAPRHRIHRTQFGGLFTGHCPGF